MGRGTSFFPGYDDFVILIYDFGNPTDSTINNLYSGMFLDIDITIPRENWGRVDSLKRFIYMWYGDYENPTIGLRLLYPKTFANLSLTEFLPDLDSTLWLYLNGTIRIPFAIRYYDYGVCASAGPFNLTPGGKQRVAYAIVGGHDSLKAKEHSDSAQIWYDREVGVGETGTRKLETRYDLRIWSNPAKSDLRLQITGKDLRIKIYDITGKLVRDMSRSSFSGVWLRISLNPGVYFVRVESKDKVIKKKAVIIE